MINIIEKIKKFYSKNSRITFFLFIMFLYILIFIQSYFALPRDLSIVFFDTWELLIFIIPLSYIILKLNIKSKAVIIFGVTYFILGLSVAFFKFPSFIKIEYATISFLTSICLIGDYFNYKFFKKSLLSELIGGNYYLALGLLVSTVFLGSIVEFLNAPSKLWVYNWPFPSIELYGVPVFLSAFGWFPWILAMLIFLYPYALKKIK